jgi:triphosphoribosyl-dephospho-CoA synthase
MGISPREDGSPPSRHNRARLSRGGLAHIACVLEATARKAGNVHRYADFADLGYIDFVMSATAIHGALDGAEHVGVGIAVYRAIETTRRLVSTNTNLGIVLLLAPLAAVPPGVNLVTGVETVLGGLTVEDAVWVYRAIRLANPGGLGEVAEQDVMGEPTAGLRDVMRLAADRDMIARQYANGYREVLHSALPSLARWIGRGVSLETAIVGTQLAILAQYPDSLIARKFGETRALEVSEWAARVIASGWPDGDAFGEFDAWLRRPEHRFNPGTTADLVTAALYAALLDGTIRVPEDLAVSRFYGP